MENILLQEHSKSNGCLQFEEHTLRPNIRSYIQSYNRREVVLIL